MVIDGASFPQRPGGTGGTGQDGRDGRDGRDGADGVTTIVTQTVIDEKQTTKIAELAATSDDTRKLVASMATTLLNEGFELQEDVLELFEDESEESN